MSVGRTMRICAPLACMLVLSACGSGVDVVPTSAAAATATDPGTTASSAIQMAAPTYKVAQSSGAVSVTVDRVGTDVGATSVNYATSNGTAVAGSDYTAASGTLTWSEGDTTSKTIDIAVNNSTSFSGNKSFAVALTNPAAGASIGNPAAATVTIAGGPSPPTTGSQAGTVAFSAASYSVAQSQGSVSVTVNRANGTSGAIQVSYATSGGSAVAGTDFTATSGTLSWADADGDTKSFSVPLGTTVFSGTRSFAVTLSAPSAGATLGTPNTSSVSITGSGPPSQGGGTGGPSAVTNLLLVNQGGPNLNNTSNTSAVTNSQTISWTAAVAGANPIASYKIYRNGAALATTTATTYTDSNATNSNAPAYDAPATAYTYNVTAVDSTGREGPQAAQYAVYAYYNGKSNWNNNDLSYGSLSTNYSSTAGSPQNGPYDISVQFFNGGFQPAVDPPQAPIWDLEIGGFNYAVVDVNPGPVLAGGALPYGTVSRIPPGDVYGWHPTVNLYDYGPAPVANKWATYKIPLAVLGMGFCKFTGSITGNKLTVTAITSGSPLVDAGGFVTGPGVPAGTYISGYDQTSAIGTFTIAGPGINSGTRVASSTLSYQRTSLYKFGIQPQVQNTTIYFNNLGFTAN